MDGRGVAGLVAAAVGLLGHGRRDIVVIVAARSGDEEIGLIGGSEVADRAAIGGEVSL